MGNAAVKEFNEKHLGQTSITEEKCISPKLMTSETKNVIGKSTGMNKMHYETEAGELIASIKANAFGTKSIVSDSNGASLAIIKVKKGFSSDDTSILRTKPAFEGQTAIPEKETEDGEALYLFAKIESHRKLRTALSSYSIVTGEADGESVFEPLYIGKKLPAMGFYVEVETPDGVCIGKMSTTGKFGQRGIVKMTAGVDVVAMCITCSSVSRLKLKKMKRRMNKK